MQRKRTARRENCGRFGSTASGMLSHRFVGHRCYTIYLYFSVKIRMNNRSSLMRSAPYWEIILKVMHNFSKNVFIAVVFSDTLTTLFGQILNPEFDIIRERAVKFIASKIKTLPEAAFTKEIEEYILQESKKVWNNFLASP